MESIHELKDMQGQVTAGSRHNHLVVYDPAAIPRDLPVDPDLDSSEPKPLSAGATRDLASRGQALVLHIPGEDCEAALRLYVDEDPPGVILERGVPVLSGARLAAPSGALKADGLEFIARPGEERTHAEADALAVPAGDYEVEVRELFSWKIKHRAAVTRQGSHASDRLAHKIVTAYTWLAILMIPANFLALPGVGVLWQKRGWSSALAVAAWILVVDVAVFGGFWILELARKRLPSLSRISDAEAAFDVENPDIAVILRRRVGTFEGAPAFTEIRLE